jgi:hypothetical protein
VENFLGWIDGDDLAVKGVESAVGSVGGQREALEGGGGNREGREKGGKAHGEGV